VAVRHNRDVIVANDLDEARDRILLGPRESSNALSLGTNGPSPLTRPDTPWWRTTSMRSAHDG
jgi:hypothetical protein